MKLNEAAALSSNANNKSPVIEQVSFNGSVAIDGGCNKMNSSLNFNKFGTLPSSNKIMAAAKATNGHVLAAKQNNDAKKVEQQQTLFAQEAATAAPIPEFQRVFGHLRKVTKQSNGGGDLANSVGEKIIAFY